MFHMEIISNENAYFDPFLADRYCFIYIIIFHASGHKFLQCEGRSFILVQNSDSNQICTITQDIRNSCRLCSEHIFNIYSTKIACDFRRQSNFDAYSISKWFVSWNDNVISCWSSVLFVIVIISVLSNIQRKLLRQLENFPTKVNM